MQAHVADNAEMKKHALQFIDCDTTELWEILPEFANMSTPYQDFVMPYTSYTLDLTQNDAGQLWTWINL